MTGDADGVPLPAVVPADLRLARQCGGAVVVAASVVILGWYTGLEQLTTVVPGFVPMRPNTALCLLLLGLVPWVRPRHRGTALTFAGVVLAVSSMTVLELALQKHWWVDQLLPGIDMGGIDPQMVPMTASCLLLLAVSALAYGLDRRRLQQTTALLPLLAAYVALVGYLFNVSDLYTVGAYGSSMALPTAVSIVLLGVAQLALIPGGVLVTSLRDRGPAGSMVRSLAPFLLVGAPVLGQLVLMGHRRGWYDTAFAVALLMTALTVASLLLLFRTAQLVRTAALAREEVAAALTALNQDLERRVREQTAEAHRVSARFQATFSSSPIGSALSTPGGSLELANDALLTLVRRGRAELVGSRVQDLFDDKHEATDLAMCQELLDGGGRAYEMERQLRTDAGDLRWVLVHVARIVEDEQVRGLLYQFQDVTSRKAAEDSARFLALHDSLTTLPNRTLLMDRLQQALHAAGRTGRGVGLLFLDLDGFKTVNDSLGHDAGDQVLCEVGRRLQQVTRAGDTVARLGGDEFVIACPDVDSERDVIGIARKVHAMLGRPWQLEDRDVSLGASIGIAFGVGRDDPERLIRKADQAMYRAKEGGRSRYEVFDDDLRQHLDVRLDIQVGLRGAVERHEIETWFQPIVDLASGRPVASEALVRWRRPAHGLVPPGDFLPVAERAGLLKEIGGSVLDRACLAMAQLPTDLCISVNVSAQQFVSPDFPARVDAALAQSGLDPSRLWLELTESAAGDAADSAAGSFRSLRARGVKVAIDDFGTGSSSFLRSRHFHVDLIKIDMTFTAALAHSPRDRELVGTMVGMGHAMGLQVIADGIETLVQRDILGDLGCDLGQGYLYAEPAPNAEPVVQTLALVPGPRRGAEGHGA